MNRTARTANRSLIFIYLVACLSAGLSGLLSGCVAPEKAGEPGGAIQMLPAGGATRDPYLTVIESFSEGEADYEGFYNQFTYRATLINSPVREALLLHEADYFKWDPAQLADARAKAAEKMRSTTEVFISFFTPDRRNDNLSDAKSIWRVYLDVNGRRYQGLPKKSRKLLAELQSLYPYHTRWNTAYLIEFPVPTATAEKGEAKFTLTGPLGTKEVSIPAAK
jgi:hypothetical protein